MSCSEISSQISMWKLRDSEIFDILHKCNTYIMSLDVPPVNMSVFSNDECSHSPALRCLPADRDRLTACLGCS